MATPIQFHLLSFEGPDPYARAGGIATRVGGLSQALVRAGVETHLWFVGDPAAPGAEVDDGGVHLHRWCQWLSAYHPAGVYDGEDSKCQDYAKSLPPHLWNQLAPALASDQRVVVLAEEWHTADAVIRLDALLRAKGVRTQVDILWNANNTFGFDRIDWPALQRAATLTTVSRYMKQRMWTQGVDPLVIPNGLGDESYLTPDDEALRVLAARFAGRALISKVARWDPDKRWLLAVDTAAELKRRGHAPLLVARGGKEAHGHEVLERARALGLRIVERGSDAKGEQGLLESLCDVDDADVVVLKTHLDPNARATLFRGSDAVLANSGHEPFGLVGLEAMAVGGLACTGASGEDYAVDGENAFVLQTNDPQEFVSLYRRAHRNPARVQELREAGMRTARNYAWSRVLDRSLMPRLDHATP